MRVLVIGCNGQLGWELCRRGQKHACRILVSNSRELDITDASAVRKQLSQARASLVINAAAYTAVDRAEQERQLAFAVNRDGPAHLASFCAEAGLPLIHISTDYVFDGCKKTRYLETDPVCPLGVYGQSKAAGEAEVTSRLRQHIIIRTAWLYGVHGNNFVKTILRLGKEKEFLRVVADQYGCPTYAADLAEAILSIASHFGQGHDIAWGTYHYCGKGQTTWHGFAEKIFELARAHDSFAVKQVLPITTEEYPTLARRPAYSVLDCALLTKNFGINPLPWDASLARMLIDGREAQLWPTFVSS